MNSNERREKLLEILRSADEPVKGSVLSAKLDVSRQVIVKDIALLRASGIEILATSTGYMILNSLKREFEIMCKNHKSNEEIFEELKTIVDLGGKAKNVIVKHPTYGIVRADLNVATNRDLKKFMEKVSRNEFKQLSTLSQDYHIHTVEVSDVGVLEEIKQELRAKNILFE